MLLLECSNTILFQICYYWSAPIVTAPIVTIGALFYSSKSPGLYKVPKLRNLNFCCCTVCFLCLGGVWRGWVGRRGFQRRKDYGLEILAKTPGLYQVPMLRNVSCIINFAKTALSTHGVGGGGIMN